jgi:hypothetical protein
MGIYDLFMAVEAHEREFEEGVGSHSKTEQIEVGKFMLRGVS